MFGDIFFTVTFAITETIMTVLGLVLEAKGKATLARRQDHVAKLLATVMASGLVLFFGMRFFGGRQFFAHSCV